MRKLVLGLLAVLALISAANAEVPALGSVAPGFSLPDQNGAPRRLAFPLLADATAAVARQYGALSDWMVLRMAKRHTFIIDPAGRIARVYLSVDPARHSQEVVVDLKALQGRAAGR